MTSEARDEDDPRRWIALAVLLIAAAIDLIGTTVATLALPVIHNDLGGSEAMLEWLIAGYSLAFALGLITGGRLGDVLGRRRVLLIGLAGFTAASGLSGAAPDPTTLVAARIAQGVFAALMAPQVLSIISTTFGPEERVKAYGMFGATAGIATVLGPLLGGALIKVDLLALSWRPIFLINVPLGLATMAAARAVVPESRSERAAKLDLGGAGLMTAALLLLLVPLIEGRQLGWPAWTLAAMAASIPAFALFALHQRQRERRAASPLIPPALFRQRAFAGGMLATLAFFSVPPALFFITTLTLQGVGFSPLHTALTFVPLSIASVPAAAASAVLAPRLGRRLPVGGALLVTLGVGGLLVAVQLTGAGITSWTLLPGMIVAGTGLGLAAPTLIGIVLGAVDGRDAGSASGALNTALQLGAAMGVAVMGAVFFGALPGGPAHAADPGPGYTNALAAALWLAVGVAALSVVSMLLLPRAERTTLDQPPSPPPDDGMSPSELSATEDIPRLCREAAGSIGA